MPSDKATRLIQENRIQKIPGGTYAAQGSKGDIYKIHLYRFPEGIVTECDCPAEGDCYHAQAARDMYKSLYYIGDNK